MSKVKCIHCGTENDPQATAGYCDECGKRLPPKALLVPSRGSVLAPSKVERRKGPLDEEMKRATKKRIRRHSLLTGYMAAFCCLLLSFPLYRFLVLYEFGLRKNDLMAITRAYRRYTEVHDQQIPTKPEELVDYLNERVYAKLFDGSHVLTWVPPEGQDWWVFGYHKDTPTTGGLLVKVEWRSTWPGEEKMLRERLVSDDFDDGEGV
jgi:hypothetical protein